MRRFGMMGLLGVMALAGCADMGQTLAGIDRGLYGVAERVSSEDRVTGSRILASGDRAAQIAQSNREMDAQLAQLTAGGGKLNAAVSASGYAKLQGMLARILPVSHFADEQAQWKVILLPDKEFNAFVNGGTYVMVYKGLLDAVQSDDELAAVMGHEIAHVAANHVGRAQAAQIVNLLDRKHAGEALDHSYTLAQEHQADKIGILYAAMAGYDPMAASRLWARMYAQQGQYAGMISSHPLNGDRAASTAQIGQAVRPYYTPGKVNPEAQAILGNNVLWQRSALPALAAGSGGGLAAIAQTAFTTYSERETAKGLAEQQQARAARVKAVEQALVVRNVSAMGPDGAVVQVTYNGTTVLQRLVLAMSNGKVRVLGNAGAVQPGQTVDVMFEKAGSGIGSGGKVAITVDEVQ